jgi:hypothetical protein
MKCENKQRQNRMSTQYIVQIQKGMFIAGFNENNKQWSFLYHLSNNNSFFKSYSQKKTSSLRCAKIIQT